MAGGKETPRQKMIGMMYLVLTAMLALNVSAEVLNAFQQFEERLSQTVKVFIEKNNTTEALFRAADKENHQRVGDWLNKAITVRQMSQEMVRYIEDLKVALVLAGDGPDAPAVVNNAVEGDKIMNLSNTDAGSNLMLNNRKAEELKGKIEKYKEDLLKYVSPADKALRTNLEKTLATPDVRSQDGSERSWEIATFADLPLIAAVPLLTKLQVDVVTAESEMMNYLLDKTDAGTVKIDNFDPIIQSTSDYVIKGGQFQAKIFLAASDRSLKPVVNVNGKDLSVVDGKGLYAAPANQVGTQVLKGTITLNGKPYPFEHKYVVAEPNVVVSPSKMNVFYRGVPNPVDVSAAGIPGDKIQVTVSNGKISNTGGNYVVTPGNGETCDVVVVAEINGVKNNMGKKTFRVKSVPDPAPEMDGIAGRTATRAQIASSQGLRALMPPDFDFDLSFKITSFMVFGVSADGYTWEEKSAGAMFSDKQKQNMRKLTAGQRLNITDIKAVGPDGKERELADLSIKVR